MAEQFGIKVSTSSNTYRIEYTKVPSDFYLHHMYPYDGLTINGLSLGAPLGTNSRSLIATNIHRFDGGSRLTTRMGLYEKPKVPPLGTLQSKRYFLSLEPEIVLGGFTLWAYARYDMTQNYNQAFLATQFNVVKENRNFFTAGIGISKEF